MPHLCRLTIAATVVAALPGTAGAQGFEGIIKTRTISVQPSALERLGATSPDQVFALPIDGIISLQSKPDEFGDVQVTVDDQAVLSIKGTKMRTHMGGSGVADTTWFGIVDLERGTWLAVQPSRHRYAEIASEDAVTGQQPQPSRAPTGRARPLGSTRTIAGMRAAGYEVRSESQITRGWMAAEQ